MSKISGRFFLKRVEKHNNMGSLLKDLIQQRAHQIGIRYAPLRPIVMTEELRQRVRQFLNRMQAYSNRVRAYLNRQQQRPVVRRIEHVDGQQNRGRNL